MQRSATWTRTASTKNPTTELLPDGLTVREALRELDATLNRSVHRTAARRRENGPVDIDFALAWQFVDLDGRPRRLVFRRDDTEAGDVLSGTGQLVAVIADPHRTDRDDAIAISRAGVDFAAIEGALDGWRDWAMLGDEAVNLAEIQRRIHTAGLD